MRDLLPSRPEILCMSLAATLAMLAGYFLGTWLWGAGDWGWILR